MLFEKKLHAHNTFFKKKQRYFILDQYKAI